MLPRGVRTFLCTGEPRSGRQPPAKQHLVYAGRFGNRGVGLGFEPATILLDQVDQAVDLIGLGILNFNGFLPR